MVDYLGPDDNPSPWEPEPDPVRLKVLGKLGEEATELGSAIFRCIIQGLDEAHPVTGEPNRLWLMKEIADVEANIERAKRSLDLDEPFIARRRAMKFDYITRWLQGLVAKKQGAS